MKVFTPQVKNCSNCKHSCLSGLVEPCNDCLRIKDTEGYYPNYVPNEAFEKEGRRIRRAFASKMNMSPDDVEITVLPNPFFARHEPP